MCEPTTTTMLLATTIASSAIQYQQGKEAQKNEYNRQKKQNERFASSACASTPATWTTHTTPGHWSVYVTDIRA